MPRVLLRPRLILLAVGAMLTGFLLGEAAPSFAVVECTVIGGDPDRYIGDQFDNVCYGNDNFDSFWGHGDGDDLGGKDGKDHIRGANGWDSLTDGQGDGDEDHSCDGDGKDWMDMFDGDHEDRIHTVIGDGFADEWDLNVHDGHVEYSHLVGCPLPD